MKKVLLYFGKTPAKQLPVSAILDGLQIPYECIDDTQTSQTVGYLMGLEGFHETDQPGTHFPMDFMLISDMTDDEILAFNQNCQREMCEMKQKAMLTMHNVRWHLIDLLSEIQKEHQYFEYAEQIQKILMDSQHLIIEDYTKDSWATYEQAFYHAYDLLQKENELASIQQGYEQLVTAKTNLIKVN